MFKHRIYLFSNLFKIFIQRFIAENTFQTIIEAVEKIKDNMYMQNQKIKVKQKCQDNYQTICKNKLFWALALVL